MLPLFLDELAELITSEPAPMEPPPGELCGEFDELLGVECNKEAHDDRRHHFNDGAGMTFGWSTMPQLVFP